MKRLVLHVGASKCGSSALQSFLSRNNIIENRSGEVFYYGSLDSEKGLYTGSGIYKRAMGNQRGYVCCPNASQILDFDEQWFELITSQIKEFFDSNGSSLILSNEGWLHNPDKFDWLEFVSRLQVEIEVICYIRPPVEMMNSAWWQWGAWTSLDLDKYVRQRKPTVLWHNFIERWNAIEWVSRVKAIPIFGDVVEDFLELLDIESSEDKTRYVNKGLPGDILRIYQRHPELRAGPHDSKIDFVLSKYLKTGSPTPWVLGKHIIEDILDFTRESNEKLTGFVDACFESRITNNAAWWEYNYYATRPVEPWGPIALDKDAAALDDLCAEMAKVICEIDARKR